METEKQMKKSKKISWRIKVLLSILAAVITIIVLLFSITYVYFAEKIKMNNEIVTKTSFEQAETDLRELLSTVERQVNQYYNTRLSWELVNNQFESKIEQRMTEMETVKDFDEILSLNSNIHGLAVLHGSGEFILSTADHKSRTGKGELPKEFCKFLSLCKENYPYITWISKESLEISDSKLFQLMADSPVLLGVKAVGEDRNVKKDSYLLVSIDEEAVRQTYESVTYNGSIAVLMDEESRIISETGESLIGTIYEEKSDFQNIEYDLDYFGWKLCNMIPQSVYLSEIKDIREFGFAIAVLAIVGVLFAGLIWNRKYTRPIQHLMDQMELVGMEQLDIEEPPALGWIELDKLNKDFYKMVQKLKDYIRRVQIVEQEKAKEELLTLQYQMNPHFLYNSLNSIRWMAEMTNNTAVANTLVTLCKIITPILRNPSFTWKLKDELEFLNNYVSMMNIRYGNNMEYYVECQTELYEKEFPRFILQPVIENCFIHGSHAMENRNIHVKIRDTEGMSVIVSNSDVYMEKEKMEKINDMLKNGEGTSEHIGLSNVKKRLQLLYGTAGDIWLETNAKGALIVQMRF